MKVHRTRSVRRPVVTADGQNLVSHAGASLLSELADRTGLTAAMSEAMADCGISWHTHDPGVVLTHLAVAIADGADCLSDLAAMREQSELYGDVASVTTAWRAVKATTSVELGEIPKAAAAAREAVWAAAPPGDITIDVDGTLLNVHSEKQDARPTYKRGYGFHPLGAWCDTTNEPLAAILRPGNAGSNDTADHLELLDRALAVLPADYRAGHEPGDDRSLVRHHIVLRADSAGATQGLVAGLVEANLEYSIGHPINAAVRQALLLFQEEEWRPAIETDGSRREGAFVAELTELMDLDEWGRTHASSAGGNGRTPVPSSRCSTCPRAGATPASSPTPAPFTATRPPSSCATAVMPGSRTECAHGRTAGFTTCPSPASPRTRPGWPSPCSQGCSSPGPR